MESNTLAEKELEQLELLDEDFEGIESELECAEAAGVSQLPLSKDDREFLALHYGDHFVLWKTLDNMKQKIGQRMKDGDMSDESQLFEIMEAIAILDRMPQVRQFKTYGAEPVSGYARNLVAAR